MEAWSLGRYRKPYLAVRAVELPPDGCTVVLDAAHDRLSIACEKPELARELAQTLERLRDPDDDRWSSLLRAQEPDPGGAWLELLARLDERSFLDDASSASAVPALEREARRVAEDVAETAAVILARLAPAQRSAAAANARRLLREVGRLVDEQRLEDEPDRERRPAARLDLLCEPNFYIAALAWQARYLRRASPPTLAAVRAALERLLRGLDEPPLASRAPYGEAGGGAPGSEGGDGEARPWLGGVYSEADRRAYLTALADLLVRSAGADAARACPAPPTGAAVVPGLALVLEAERATRAALARLGEGRYVRAIRGLAPGASPLMVGCYVEEYHVNARFVEILMPLLHKRLAAGLRGLMLRYYEEELGHEAFEKATCLSLGVSEAALAEALPLPLHLAFLDVFTQLAEEDPVGFMAAVMVTEGLPGEASLVNELLSDAGRQLPGFHRVVRQHEELNTGMNHSSIARLLLSQVAAVSPAARRRALAHLLFVLELNHRAWDAVYDFYGAQAQAALHGWLSRRLPVA